MRFFKLRKLIPKGEREVLTVFGHVLAFLVAFTVWFSLVLFSKYIYSRENILSCPDPSVHETDGSVTASPACKRKE